MEFYKSGYSDKKKYKNGSRSNTGPSRSFRNSRNDSPDSRFSSRDDREQQATTVTCADCGVRCEIPFVPRTNRPVYCRDCFRKNKPQDTRDDRYSRDDKRYSRDDRYSKNDRYSRDDKEQATTVTCADCGVRCEIPFVPRTNRPVYCRDCFRKNKPQDTRDDRYSRDDKRYSRDDRYSKNDRYSRDNKEIQPTVVTCADCGVRCEIPFVPRTNKPVYCRDCFKENKPQDARDDRYPRDNNRESDKQYPRSKRVSKDTTKLSKKQQSFFSNGSDKFYASMREKLFEILGGETCSSCGFKDKRALGFSHKYDNDTFDSISRGGTASSWGKYISEPKLAREELEVLCLNCNETNQPSKPKDKTKPKTSSKYFS